MPLSKITPNVTLHPTPATQEAARTLVNIHNAACADDPFLELMYGPLDEEADSFAADILGIMRGDPTVRFTQAVVTSESGVSHKDAGADTVPDSEPGTGTVVGWAWWNIYPTKNEYLAAARADKERAKKPPATAISPAAYLDWKAGIVERREKWIENDHSSHGHGVEEGERESGVAILQVFVVHPSYQNLGIGTQLLKHGLEEVKAQNVPAWLEASEEGYRVYTRCGFRDVQDDVVIDARKYGREGEHRGICMLFNP